MLESMKKGLSFTSDKLNQYIREKIKEGIEKKINTYKKKIKYLILSQVLLTLGVLLLIISIIKLTFRSLPLESFLFFVSLATIIISIILRQFD